MQDQIQTDEPKRLPLPDPVFVDYLISIKRRREEIRSILLVNKSRILKALKKLCATTVVVSYSGSGDSGQIDHVGIFQDKNELKPETNISVLVTMSKWDEPSSTWAKRSVRKSMPLAEAIEALVYDWLESEHAGWENNDGASGECTIDVTKDDFLLSHTTYYTESDCTEHSL